MLLDPKHSAKTSRAFWEEELANCRALLNKINRRIYELDIETYSLNTGQDGQSVKRSDLASLVDSRERLLRQTAELEAKLGFDVCCTPQCIQAVPL